MKNYELIMELVKHPAGAEVEFDRVLSDDEIQEIEPDANGVVVSIKSVDYISEGRILLS